MIFSKKSASLSLIYRKNKDKDNMTMKVIDYLMFYKIDKL